ncbi:MAG: septum formation family protein, partial [Nocardioides sp.]
MTRTHSQRAAIVVTFLLALGGCGREQQGENVDPRQVDSVAPPEVGACRSISPADLANASNASPVVPCAEEHTAETIHVEQLPDEYRDADYEDATLAVFAAKTCTPRFTSFLGADESTGMRTILAWSWFRPSQAAWSDGARWFRCDVVGGTAASAALVDLPATTKGLFADGPRDKWMACVNEPTVSDAPR